MPSMITWEPCYAKEMEWILADATRRHCQKDNYDREGVVVRAVTMGVKQKSFINNLKSQARFADKKKDFIFDAIRKDVLSGGYVLVDNSHLEDYQPGENVVNILVMGSAVDQALQASERLKQKGIYANIIICTSADLLLGRFAEKDNYKQLKSLGINGNIHLVATAGETLDSADVLLLGARQVPIVSIADGELGLLDNAGSILGVPQIALGVKKFSKSGKPDEVFTYHGMDAESIQNKIDEQLRDAQDQAKNAIKDSSTNLQNKASEEISKINDEISKKIDESYNLIEKSKKESMKNIDEQIIEITKLTLSKVSNISVSDDYLKETIVKTKQRQIN